MRNLVTLWLSLLIASIACGQSKPVSQIYSDVRYIEEAGDLLGNELEFQVQAAQVSGTLRIYEGGCGTAIRVSGSLVNGVIHVQGDSDAFGRVTLDGKLFGKTLSGDLRMEKAQSKQMVNLKKIPKPHC